MKAPHYNYFRDYDPTTGRYQESDPVGLESGVNTFGYVNAYPIAYIDPFGLWKVAGPHVPKPDAVNPLLYVFMNCVQRCYGYGLTLVVTATTNGHSAGAHSRKRAVDFILPDGQLGADDAICCSLSCGARYVQDEYRHPSPNSTGGHIHAQMDSGKGGASGTGKYPKPTCKPCPGPSLGDAL